MADVEMLRNFSACVWTFFRKVGLVGPLVGQSRLCLCEIRDWIDITLQQKILKGIGAAQNSKERKQSLTNQIFSASLF